MTSANRPARPAPRRIHIIGDQGSGKTTLAARLGERLAIPVHHLDEVARDEAGRDRDPVVLIQAAEAIAASPAWITEGLHQGWTGPLFAHAERVVWLDTVGRSGAAIRITRRFVAGAAAETRRRGWRGLFRFRDYARHASGLGQTMVRIARSGRVAVRDTDGTARPGELDRFIAAHPERLVHCRTRDDVDRLVAGLVPSGLVGAGLPAAGAQAAAPDGEARHAASREPGGEDQEPAKTGGTDK
ncbi:MAG TPA: hypothetical protein VES19_11900 [Candidatus Limnocylindrales bacterium]|nr:hypothetical protein [Candidatus Limnocylindrales bacterium]